MRYFTKLTNTKAEALIFDYIGWGGVEAATFAKELAELKAEGVTDFTARINSPGGSVFDGITLYNLLEENKFTVVVEGLAASIASVIALAGSPVIMRSNSYLMIHNPWTFAGGDANYLKKVQDNLEMIKTTIMNIYQKKTGLTADELSAMMDDETWLTASDAQAKKFCDQVDGTSDSGFANRGQAINTYFNQIFSQPNKEKDQSAMLITLLLNVFGVQAATEAEASNIIAQKVGELKNLLAKANTDLQAAQAELSTFRARDQQVKENRIKARLDEAVQNKVIDPAERPVWENNLRDDEEGTLTILNAKKPQAAPSVEPPQNRKQEGRADLSTVTDLIRNSMKGQN